MAVTRLNNKKSLNYIISQFISQKMGWVNEYKTKWTEIKLEYSLKSIAFGFQIQIVCLFKASIKNNDFQLILIFFVIC